MALPTVEQAAEMTRMALAEAGYGHVRVGSLPCPSCGLGRIGVERGLSAEATAAALRAFNLIWPTSNITKIVRPWSVKRCRCSQMYRYDEAAA